MSKECTTHHFACECREEKFKQLEQENAALREQLQWTTRRIEILSTTFYGIEDLFKEALTEMFEDSLKVEEKEAQP